MTVLDENSPAHESRHSSSIWRPLQTGSFVSFDLVSKAANMRSFRRGGSPAPDGRGVFLLRRRFRHWQGEIFHRFGHSASIFLPRLRSTPVTALPRYYAGSDSPAVLGTAGVSQLNAIVLPNVLPPTTRCTTVAEFHSLSCTRRAHRASTPLAAGHYSTRIWASPLARVLTNAPGRIAFVSCGPSVPFPLLSTPPCGDAVTGRYKSKRFDLSRTYTSLHNHTHWRTSRPSSGGRTRHRRRRASLVWRTVAQ
jgi:hypothetical protein